MTRHWIARVAAGLILVATVAGCSHPNRSAIGTTPPPAGSSSRAIARFVAPTAPVVVSWGGVGDQLAIVIRNASTRTIVAARVRVTASAADGRIVRVTTVQPSSTCCAVFNLAPGAHFGIFANLAGTVGELHKVQVTYLGVPLTSVATPNLRVTVSEARLSQTTRDATVTARVSTTGTVPPVLAGQAILTDRRGRLIAVISGRFYCFADGTTRRLRMQLLRPAPAGARLDQVIVTAIPRSADRADAVHCPPSQ